VWYGVSVAVDADDAQSRENLKQEEIVSMVNTLRITCTIRSLHSELERVRDATSNCGQRSRTMFTCFSPDSLYLLLTCIINWISLPLIIFLWAC